jgi:hypothetical protein
MALSARGARKVPVFLKTYLGGAPGVIGFFGAAEGAPPAGAEVRGTAEVDGDLEGGADGVTGAALS